MLILAVVPYTLLVIRPTDNRLLDPRRDRRSAETLLLLKAAAYGFIALLLLMFPVNVHTARALSHRPPRMVSPLTRPFPKALASWQET